MKRLELCGMLLVAALAASTAAAQENAVKEFIPTGKLRFGVAFAPKMSALFVIKEADGSPRGITADLGNALAQKLGVPVEFMVAPNTGILTDALGPARIDAAFMPVDDERRKRLDFGPAYAAGREHLHGDGGVRHQNTGRGRPAGRPRRRRRQHHDHSRRRPHLEAYAPIAAHFDRRCSGDAARGQGRCVCAVAGFAAGLRRAVPRLAYRRWRFPADRHRHRGAEGPAGGVGRL